MKSILVTGCNRGLGLGIVKHLLNDINPPKNVIATCRNIEKAAALLPVLKKAASSNETMPLSSAKAAVVNMSSVLGSVALNSDGGLYPYRCSKAAINMATKSLSVDLKDQGILVTCIHPGWVQTDMGGRNAPLSVDASCSGMVQLIKGLNEKHHGKFYQYDGNELQW